MTDHLIADHTPLTADQWAERWQQEADARNDLHEKYTKEKQALANAASDCFRLIRENDELRLNSRTIQQQGVIIGRLISSPEGLIESIPLVERQLYSEVINCARMTIKEANEFLKGHAHD